MAIKERKQITGTEAQIKGYAGHNGVLAYATDTKHLHVLSGTAGTTTKLANMSDIPSPVDISGKADRTYVDTELAKKQAKGDYATNAQLTEGLAGKEDKGTCLPLTGGNITGSLNLKYGGQLYQYKSPTNTYGYTVLSSKGDGTAPNSCALYLANPDSLDKGTMLLRYTDGSGAEHDLTMDGEADGLLWNGKPVDSISGFESNYIRYTNGLQIVFVKVGIPSGRTKLYNYPVPFVGEVIVVDSQNQNININSVDWASATQCSLASQWGGNEKNASNIVIIGRWR